MPYFFILPAYLIFLLVMLFAAIVMRFVPQFQPLSGYIFGGTIGSLPAFVIGNVLVIIVGVLPVWLTQGARLPEWLANIMQLFIVAILFIGPFVATVLSVLAGFAAGVYFVFRRRRSHAV